MTKSLLPTAIDRALEEKELPDLKASLVQLQNPERCDSITDHYLKTSFLVMINPNSLALYNGDGQLCEGQADLAAMDTGRRRNQSELERCPLLDLHCCLRLAARSGVGIPSH